LAFSSYREENERKLARAWGKKTEKKGKSQIVEEGKKK
jgi:hypothetical protein